MDMEQGFQLDDMRGLFRRRGLAMATSASQCAFSWVSCVALPSLLVRKISDGAVSDDFA